MDKIIPIRIDYSDIIRLDSLIKEGKFRNRNDAIRYALRMLLDKAENPHIIRSKFVAKIVSQIIKSHWPHRVKSVILYGSVAKEQMTAESDIDIAVIIDKMPTYKERIDILDNIDKLLPEWSSVISLQYFSTNSFKNKIHLKGTIESDIKNEGINLLNLTIQ